MIKDITRISVFLIIIILCFYGVTIILKPKFDDGIYQMTRYYELEEDTVDVLILGSSHAFESFNTGTLWDEYGIAAFDLCASGQPLCNTYHYLVEGLKTQNPELIILEGYGLVLGAYTDDYGTNVKSNFGLKLSKNKIESIKDSVGDDWVNWLLDYTHYHSRYKDLTSEDFLPHKGDDYHKYWMGYGCNTLTSPAESIDVTNYNDCEDLPDETENWYRCILNYASENSIPIIVVVAPYAGVTLPQEGIYNRASQIAAEYDVPFIDCNRQINNINLDLETDVADSNHLNCLGSIKFSRYIGDCISKKYELSDHRQDEKYDAWQKDANCINELICAMMGDDSADGEY